MDISLFREQVTRLSKRLRQEAQNHPETWSQMLVLSAIDQMDGTATPSKIAEAENMRSSNVASLLRDLQARELITRTHDTSDLRRTWIGLSEKGRLVLQTSRDRRDEWLGNAVEAYLSDKELKQLEVAGALMEKLAGYKKLSD
ncbi:MULTISPECIES: MarR family winged helix-turn-helix transcriptional regulator [Pseudomonas]|uniref:MarR family transcriptional regulator n=8 Tax=Pseudomonas syringae group TaxID=136849 RepID=A0A3M6HHH1_PSEAJ|nr:MULTISPECIES: MarR family transcriptional regulator [Pseudomonas]EGH06023.1 MarR family transcriptional regulator [Pseudomonas amygdali pv. aesculi str. 0893_23]KPC53618.1 MarR family transcriptional regulator [Pseudomonas amygdali pv. morsprunorum]KPW25658.1 MarR family transcriptional regulator [Pseudomonas amygdali pv. aesculi]KPW90668.1 MarR family transcriptional regulator [Pseudomonas syringae pv. castaneae]KPX98907.1 MarR family transcriptional regulator [Pseudomonas amygdali pv. mor